jgi:hypothetical protein
MCTTMGLNEGGGTRTSDLMCVIHVLKPTELSALLVMFSKRCS